MSKKELLREQLLANLPVAFSRAAIPKLLPGIVSSGHLANLQSKGIGPEHIIIKRKAIYTREAFVDWLLEQCSDDENLHKAA